MGNEIAYQPVRPGYGVIARQGEHGRREECPRIPVERSPDQVVRQRQDVAAQRIRDEDPPALKNHDARPAEDGDGQLRQVGVNGGCSWTPLLAWRNGRRWLHRFFLPASFPFASL
jgi:hypothetical protein